MAIILYVTGGGSGFDAFANDDAIYVTTTLGANTSFEYYINGDFKGEVTLGSGNYAVDYSAFAAYSDSGLLSHPAGTVDLQIKSPVGSSPGSESPYTSVFSVTFGDLAGTQVTSICEGTTLKVITANGNGGFSTTYEQDSPSCGYVPPPPFGQADVDAALTDYVPKDEINTYIQEWWDIEVQPELERLALAVEAVDAKLTVTSAALSTAIAAAIKDIERQLTPTLNSQVLGDQIAKMRELAAEEGAGIKTVSSAETVSNAVLYHLYVTQAQILADPDASASEQAASLTKLNNIIRSITSNLGS